MSAGNTEEPTEQDSLRKEKALLRKIALGVLIAGLTASGLVFWLGTRSHKASLDEYEQARQRSEARQMELMYGRSGDLVGDFFNALKRPGPQAATIAVVTLLISGACFYLGHPLDESDN